MQQRWSVMFSVYLIKCVFVILSALLDLMHTTIHIFVSVLFPLLTKSFKTLQTPTLCRLSHLKLHVFLSFYLVEGKESKRFHAYFEFINLYVE